MPILGKDAVSMRANYWVAQPVMAAGETPAADKGRAFTKRPRVW